MGLYEYVKGASPVRTDPSGLDGDDPSGGGRGVGNKSESQFQNTSDKELAKIARDKKDPRRKKAITEEKSRQRRRNSTQKGLLANPFDLLPQEPDSGDYAMGGKPTELASVDKPGMTAALIAAVGLYSDLRSGEDPSVASSLAFEAVTLGLIEVRSRCCCLFWNITVYKKCEQGYEREYERVADVQWQSVELGLPNQCQRACEEIRRKKGMHGTAVMGTTHCSKRPDSYWEGEMIKSLEQHGFRKP
jgi:hypothetical protein